MKAKYQDHYSTERQNLHEVVPLDTPFTLSIEPTSFCNLKCNYCIHSLPKEEMTKAGHIFAFMERPVFDTFVEQLKKFPRPLRVISFIGAGEPLLHKDLPYMIRQLSRNGLADNIQILTNGTLLTHQLSSDLINAGLKTFKISINGLSADDYLETCGVSIDFEKFMSDLKFLYKNKGDTQINIKTVKSVLKDRKKEDFFALFGDYCDKITIENTLPVFSAVSYDNIIDSKTNPTSRYSSMRRTAQVCSVPFYRSLLRHDGRIRVCCNSAGGFIGNFNNFFDAWNGARHKEFMLKVLRSEWNGVAEVCNGCLSRNDHAYEGDDLDPYVDELCGRILAL